MHSPTTRTTAVTLVAIAVVIGVACWTIGGAHAPERGRVANVVDVTSDGGRTETIAGTDLGAEDGLVDSATIVDLADSPAVTGLDADLRSAVEQATAAAHDDGVEVLVNSGWRSARYQQALLDQAVEQYGSMSEARLWVNTPERSTHVQGKAVDVGPTDAMSWMDQHGATYGLCRTYANELWHFERVTTPGGTCPQAHEGGTAG